MSAPIQPELREQMNALAAALDEMLNGPKLPVRNRKYGFALFTFEFGKTEGGRVNYISNAGREDMLVAVREWLARAEGRVPSETKGRQ